MASVLDINPWVCHNQHTQGLTRDSPGYSSAKWWKCYILSLKMQPCRAANGSQYTQAEDNMSQTLTFKMLHALFATRNTCRSRAAWVYSVDSAWMSVFIYFPLHVSQKWESHFLQHMKSESHTKQLVTQVCYSFYTFFSQDNSLSIRRSCLPLKSTWLR